MTTLVTICGSMRFYDLMLTVAAEETRAGRIVLLPHAVVQPEHQGSALKVMLDRLHREKIDLSDRIIVVSDQTGYYGTSTAGEIGYACAQGKAVDYRRVTTSDAAPETVPCGFGCGYLALSEADLNGHEAQCDNAWIDLPTPRPVRSTRRSAISQHSGGER